MTREPAFYIVSSENINRFEPRACYISERLRNSSRDDFALVEVEPEFSSEIYRALVNSCVPKRPTTAVVVLASRSKSESLFPLKWGGSKRLFGVFIYLLKSGEKPSGGILKDDDLLHEDNGLIFATAKEAILFQKKWKEGEERMKGPKFKGGRGSEPPLSW
jgi:hypothetical protein